jgi:hypothetical protein
MIDYLGGDCRVGLRPPRNDRRAEAIDYGFLRRGSGQELMIDYLVEIVASACGLLAMTERISNIWPNYQLLFDR